MKTNLHNKDIMIIYNSLKSFYVTLQGLINNNMLACIPTAIDYIMASVAYVS